MSGLRPQAAAAGCLSDAARHLAEGRPVKKKTNDKRGMVPSLGEMFNCLHVSAEYQGCQFMSFQRPAVTCRDSQSLHSAPALNLVQQAACLGPD